MSIQILQYEFLGPINLDEWGPPMEKVVFLIFSRKKDSFHIIYAGVCEKTEEKDYFIKNEDYKNWAKVSGFKNPLYLAILPMFDSSPEARMVVRNKIIRHYRPACNAITELNKKPDFTIRTKSDLDNSKSLEKKIDSLFPSVV